MEPGAKDMPLHTDEHNSRFLRRVMAEMNLMERKLPIRKIRVMPAAEPVMAVGGWVLAESQAPRRRAVMRAKEQPERNQPAGN